MGCEGPLDHAELAAIDELLDSGDLDEAQRQLASVGQSAALDAGTSYLATRLLYLRGRLDAAGVAERLHDLLATVGHFPEAERLLAEAGGTPPASASPDPAPGADSAPEPGRPEPELPPLSPPPPADSAPEPSAPGIELGMSSSMPAVDSPQNPDELPLEVGMSPLPAAADPGASPPPLEVGMSPLPAAADPVASAPALELGMASASASELSASQPEEPAGRLEDPDDHRRRFVRTSAIPRAPALPHISEPPDRTPSYAPDGVPAPDAAPEPVPDLAASGLDDSGELSPPAPQHISDLAVSGAGALPEHSADPLPAEGRDEAEPAGRYAGQPRAEERVAMPRGGVRPLPRSEPPTSDPPVLRRNVQSGAPPPPTLGALPSLFELATLLDDGEYRRVINAIDSAPDAGPAYVLMRARALAGEGHRDDALGTLERLTRAPLLDPELRAGAARELIELGELSLAVALARHAYEDDPEPPLVRITLAWALLRGACRRSDARALEEASELLEGLRTRGGPRPALVSALRALAQALGGDPERAIAAAQRALAQDAASTDALSAIALASARLERPHDAQQAWLRLLGISYEEADAISDELEALGIELAQLDPSLRPGSSGEEVFETLERMPGEERRPEAIAAFEQLARARLTELAESGSGHDFSIIAPVAAGFLASTAISRDFALYDLSLWSIERLDAFLHTLYASERHPSDSDDFPVILLVGSYLGEALRDALGARWEGTVARIDEARVVGNDDESWAPFEMVRARIERGEPLDAGLDRHAEGWDHRVAAPESPPCPWDPLDWPEVGALHEIGSALPSSPIGSWCAAHGGPLDLTLPSLAVLDRYVDLVAPLRAPPTPDAAWSKRPAVLLGAYVGEVLRNQLRGTWQKTDGDGAFGYSLVLGSNELKPIVAALARLEGGSQTSLSEYARKIARR